ncbi:metallophosphoesterase [Myxococcota bacterium]|nr:metallophosphoesterase [Myxococcota bacterium]
MKTIIIGDIHGCHDELLELLAKAAITDDDWIVSVGDIVDRGPDPGAVIDLFRTRPRTVVLMGNHERKHVRGVFSYSQEVTRAQLEGRYADDVAWMKTLPYHLERPDVRVVHFGHFPGVPLADVPEDVRAGTTSGEGRLRERFGVSSWWDHYDDDVPIVFGHHVVGPEPLVVRDRVFGIDTGACHGLRLTGLVLPERTLVSVPAREDHWARVRRAFQAPVLRTYRWDTQTFEQITKKLKGLRDPELGDDVLARVAAWRDAIEGALPELCARLDAELVRLDATDDPARETASHAAASWLFRRRAGKLSSARLGCATPRDVLDLARALGVDLPAAPL